MLISLTHYLISAFPGYTGDDLVDAVYALQCAKPKELPAYRACLLSVLAGLERVNGTLTEASWDILCGDAEEGDNEEVKALQAVGTQLQALLDMAPSRRYWSLYCADKLPTHHGLTLEGQLALHRQPDGPRARSALLPASTNKVWRWELFACWQDELELLQSLATSDGSWPDELAACLPSPPSDSSAAPSLVASSDDDEDWGSPPSSPRVTPALVARLSAWIASSSQLPTT